MPPTRPPPRAISLMNRVLMKACSGLGAMKTVSTPALLRLVNAIWISYSRSETVRMPRRTTETFSALAKSTIRPRNALTSTFWRWATSRRIIARRS